LYFFRPPLPAKNAPTQSPNGFAELVWSDGTPALPTFVRNPANAAWVVLAAVQLLRHTPPDSAPAAAASYFADLIVPTMQSLRRWSRPTTGGPPPGFDPVLLRDASSVSNELLYYLAVEGAFEMATAAKSPPEKAWQSWQRELDALLRFRIVNEADGWELSPTLAAWAARTLAPTNPLRDAKVRMPSGTIPLGDCLPPTLPGDPASTTANAFDSVVDLVALLGNPEPTP
jgi:hypothetical protein